MPLPSLTETLGRQRAAHLLRRATFGASKAQIDEFAAFTPQEAISRLFDLTVPEPTLPIDTATGTEWISGVTDANSGDDTLQEYLKRWFIGQYLGQSVDENLRLASTTREKITLFYHTYFTTIQSKVNDSRALYFQNALFRLFAFDKEDVDKEILNEDTNELEPATLVLNIKELTKRICVDNAMLIFLDGNLNVQGSPNENYAREMLELYTIGRGLEGTLPDALEEGDYINFTEQDVRAAANVLTGFDVDDTFQNIDPLTELPYGVIKGGATATAHETNDSLKVFSSRLDNAQVTANQDLLLNGQPTEESVLDEISQLVELIYTKEETARHLCRRIYRFYVYYEITQEIDDTIIAEMAQTLINNDYKIQYVLEELFQSEHFFEAVSGVEDDKFGGIIKSPLDLALTTLNFFEVQLPDYQTDTELFYQRTGEILNSISDMGMNLYEPFEVAGYSAYHQFPVYNRNWISTNYLTQRYNFIRQLLEIQDETLSVDVYTFVSNTFNAEANDAKSLIINLAPYLYPMANNLDFDVDGGDLTKERIRFFLQAFLGFTDYEAESDMALTEWQSLYADPDNYLEIGEFLKRLFNAMMQSPEYQLF
ncbi:DUF1800 family protein [Fulvivirga lutea]|uniref:DUF1800 family protein n=1 Tax=Fulvivirga lutea TaxID=2810512 RepID=A0A974WE87_9BACT|nr:DUF1800 family protein [Fulvivirga lutea]QSE96704.1 DUF1800 family protein [Fulvivirga lutea]